MMEGLLNCAKHQVRFKMAMSLDDRVFYAETKPLDCFSLVVWLWKSS